MNTKTGAGSLRRAGEAVAEAFGVLEGRQAVRAAVFAVELGWAGVADLFGARQLRSPAVVCLEPLAMKQIIGSYMASKGGIGSSTETRVRRGTAVAPQVPVLCRAIAAVS
jgi:hypothetical protein